MKTIGEVYNIVHVHIKMSPNVQMPNLSLGRMVLGATIELEMKVKSTRTNLNLDPNTT
jgi:hypothetical protein